MVLSLYLPFTSFWIFSIAAFKFTDLYLCGFCYAVTCILCTFLLQMLYFHLCKLYVGFVLWFFFLTNFHTSPWHARSLLSSISRCICNSFCFVFISFSINSSIYLSGYIFIAWFFPEYGSWYFWVLVCLQFWGGGRLRVALNRELM